MTTETTHTAFDGSPYTLRDLTMEDLRGAHRDGDENHEIDPRWKLLTWIAADGWNGENCVAWQDGDEIFMPSDGQSGTAEYDQRGPEFSEYAYWTHVQTGQRAIVGLPNSPLAIFA